jgi:hypothetical protein
MSANTIWQRAIAQLIVASYASANTFIQPPYVYIALESSGSTLQMQHIRLCLRAQALTRSL